jgi:SAM-dependent methyltransferase
MKDKDKQEYIDRYTKRLNTYGYSPETLGWGRNGRQDVRFSVLTQPILNTQQCSVLDIGCGFADLYSYLITNGWKGRYVGVDLVPSLLEIAKERNPELEVYNYDIEQSKILGNFDYVVASGIFNAKLNEDNNEQHIVNSLSNMLEISEKMVCVDFMSTYVDFQKEGSWHTDPSWLINQINKITKRFSIRYDYMPFEFAAFLYKDDMINKFNTFNI